MAKIILLSCVKKKLNKTAKAKDLYISDFFQKSFAFAKSCNPDKIFILSAKYHLLQLDDIIDPYELTLNKMDKASREVWSATVLNSLSKHTDLLNDQFIIIAGERYRENLLPHIKNYIIPLQGLKSGQQK